MLTWLSGCVTCLEAGEQRSQLQMVAARDSQTLTEQHQAEATELRRQLGSTRDDVALLQQQLSDASDRQAALVVELRRMAQQLSSGQMELDASRAIASAQRETILVREAEIARLEARVSLVQRSVQQSTRHADDRNIRSDGPLQGSDMADVSVTSRLHSEADIVCAEQREAGSTETSVELPARISGVEDSNPRVCDNPDSLLAMWHQLQLNDSLHQSAGDSTSSSKVPDLTTTVEPPSTASRRLGSALDQKARVQNRIKALIGYREPVKKSISAAKPRMSVRPQPLNQSKSSTITTTMKPQRRPSASNSANTSQLSTAVSHYAASALSADYVPTS